MHMIVGVLSVIGLAVVGFIGHVLAHDFCERAPSLARWLLALAAKWLPVGERDRYAEEWAAHLADCEGVFAKLYHAFGCLWCARRMRYQTYKGIKLSVAFNLPTIGRAVIHTDLCEVGILLWLYQQSARTKVTNYAFVGALTTVFWRRVFVDARERNGITGKQFGNYLKDTKRGDWVPTAINLSIKDETIELIGLLRSLGNSVKALLVKINGVLNSKTQTPPMIDGPPSS